MKDRTELEELIARTMWDDTNERGSWQTHASADQQAIYRSNAKAILTALEQECVVCPKVATREMEKAGYVAPAHPEHWRRATPPEMYHNFTQPIYTAMLSASPFRSE